MYADAYLLYIAADKSFLDLEGGWLEEKEVDLTGPSWKMQEKEKKSPTDSYPCNM